MTDTEKQAIIDAVIDAVLSSLRTNSRTINELTPTTSIDETDYFELNGGRRIAYCNLAEQISSITTTELETVGNDLKAQIKGINHVGVFSGITTAYPTAIRNTEAAPGIGEIVFCDVFGGVFLNYYDGKYWGLWEGCDKLGTSTPANAGITPDKNKIYIDSARKLYLFENGAMKEIASGHKDIINKIGAPGGIAPLDENGKVADTYLPEYRDVHTFAGMVKGPSLQLSSYGGVVVAQSKVFYDTERNTFVMYDSLGKKYYTNWNGSMKFGITGGDGVTPLLNRIYICASEGEGYYWDGAKLVPLSSEATDTDVRDYLAAILGEVYLPEAGGSLGASCDCEEATLEEIMAAADAVFNND